MSRHRIPSADELEGRRKRRGGEKEGDDRWGLGSHLSAVLLAREREGMAPQAGGESVHKGTGR
jgi:hypothetical protein